MIERCPMCGNDARLYYITYPDAGWQIRCTACACNLAVDDGSQTAKWRLIDAWNKKKDIKEKK